MYVGAVYIMAVSVGTGVWGVYRRLVAPKSRLRWLRKAASALLSGVCSFLDVQGSVDRKLCVGWSMSDSSGSSGRVPAVLLARWWRPGSSPSVLSGLTLKFFGVHGNPPATETPTPSREL